MGFQSICLVYEVKKNKLKDNLFIIIFLVSVHCKIQGFPKIYKT